MYNWRKMTVDERREVLKRRVKESRPFHSPPVWESGSRCYLITAACYEHAPHIGRNEERMSAFSIALCDVLEACGETRAWVVLPNHYHALVFAENVKSLRFSLGRLHGRTSFRWNGEDEQRGRKVWHASAETAIKSDGHFWATMNYIHQNPIKHGYANKWEEWPWSSAREYLAIMGRERAREIWTSYPVHDYGKDWDV